MMMRRTRSKFQFDFIYEYMRRAPVLKAGTAQALPPRRLKRGGRIEAD
jgi:hypothetical protein